VTDTDMNIDQALDRQNERLNRLSNAVGNLVEALFPVLNPERDGTAEAKGDTDVPLVAPVLAKLNDNNDRIHEMYSQIFEITDRLAIRATPEKEEAALDSSH
jgi:hypothetical protein